VLIFFFPSRDKIDADNIESHRRRSLLWELANISAGKSAKHVALVFIDRGFGRSHVVG